MSGQALRDLHTPNGSDNKFELLEKGNQVKAIAENGKNNNQEEHRKSSASLPSDPANGNGCVKPETGVGNSEVEYIESENLNDLEDVEAAIKGLLSGLDSKDWVLLCETLNNVRRLSLFHKEAMINLLEDVITLLVKSLKNPRSAVCKTALMTSADLCNAFNDQLIDFLDPLLVQLLLKASQDKKFVCEAAERALSAMTTNVSPSLLLPKLQPYLKNRNPRIRAKASMCFSRSVPHMGLEGIKAYGIDDLIQVAASQLSDQLPESREAARTLLLELQTVYEKSQDFTPSTVADPPELDSWEHFCQSKLSPINAQAVLRVTNIAREGLIIGSQHPDTSTQQEEVGQALDTMNNISHISLRSLGLELEVQSGI